MEQQLISLLTWAQNDCMADGDVTWLADSLWRTKIDSLPIGPIADSHPALGIEDA